MNPADPVSLAQALIRCPSVTPEDGGALAVLEAALRPLGFDCRRLRFQAPDSVAVDNLYARLGDRAPHFCFAGHTDVVPPGDLAAWSVDPFAGTIAGGRLFGRGAVDMKGAIAAFVAALGRHLAERGPPAGSISLLITGDEEGVAVNGTKPLLEALAAAGERWQACLVGEPTNPTRLGEAIKVGRRGSLNARLTVHGVQGHVAYPDLADNPLPRLVRMLAALTAEPLDRGSAHFQPSTLALTTIDTGNPAVNVIPARASAGFNIRFNDCHSAAGLKSWIGARLDAVGGSYHLETAVSGESFLTASGPLTRLAAAAIGAVTGLEPELSTSGGTSDARFIKDYCPVIEFGLVGRSMHKADEHVTLEELEQLSQIYRAMLDRFFVGGEDAS
jgi:succinyl-diaminopimelate desuccinylase